MFFILFFLGLENFLASLGWKISIRESIQIFFWFLEGFLHSRKGGVISAELNKLIRHRTDDNEIRKNKYYDDADDDVYTSSQNITIKMALI